MLQLIHDVGIENLQLKGDILDWTQEELTVEADKWTNRCNKFANEYTASMNEIRDELKHDS